MKSANQFFLAALLISASTAATVAQDGGSAGNPQAAFGSTAPAPGPTNPTPNPTTDVRIAGPGAETGAVGMQTGPGHPNDPRAALARCNDLTAATPRDSNLPACR